MAVLILLSSDRSPVSRSNTYRSGGSHFSKPPAKMEKRRSRHWEQLPQCDTGSLMSRDRVQLTVFDKREPKFLYTMLSLTSFLVSHCRGVLILTSQSSKAEKIASNPRNTLGWVVRVARAPKTSPASGRLMLMTPFS